MPNPETTANQATEYLGTAQDIRDEQLAVIRSGLERLTGMHVSRYDAQKVLELVVTAMGASVIPLTLENLNGR